MINQFTNYSFLVPFSGQIIASKSLFTYGPHENTSTFTDVNYVPMFIDNITWTSDSLRQEAQRTCGNNSNCLFDVAMTVNASFGASTKQLEQSNNQVNIELGKVLKGLYFR